MVFQGLPEGLPILIPAIVGSFCLAAAPLRLVVKPISIVVFRPRLSAKEKAQALLRAFIQSEPEAI